MSADKSPSCFPADLACDAWVSSPTDAKVEASRKQRQGYADQQPEPQVVSLNGTLASEAVTAALMLLAGDDRLVPYRRYAYPPGKLVEVDTTPRPGCPSCSAAYFDHEVAPATPDVHRSRTIVDRFVSWLQDRFDRLRCWTPDPVAGPGGGRH